MSARWRGASWAGCVVALLAMPAWATAQDARSLLEAASARYGAVTTLCADFEQRLTVPLLGDESTGRGRLCQRQPDLFAMRFSEPVGDVLVADGESVWIYYPSMDSMTVIRFAMATAPGGFDFHREFLERPAEKYNLTYGALETVAGHQTHRIELVPRGDPSFRSATVWIDVGAPLLRQVQVVEENESIRTVTLHLVELDAAPPVGWFTFAMPDGAQVIAR